ncbi:MAG: UrcA family protein [Sphingomicrobium sp.]
MYYGKALAVCGASLIAAVSVAGTPRNPIVIAQPQNLVERRIPYADLNLAAASGERILNRRIGHEVDSLCNEAVEGTTTSLEYRNCESGAWRSARPQVSLALQRAHEIATAGSSMIDATAIAIAMPK